MKTYKITYKQNGTQKTWTDRSGMGLINTMKFCAQSMNIEIEDIVNVEIEQAKDPLMEFLDNNPNTTEETPKATYTKVQAMEWQAWADAEQRAIDDENSFYL